MRNARRPLVLVLLALPTTIAMLASEQPVQNLAPTCETWPIEDGCTEARLETTLVNGEYTIATIVTPAGTCDNAKDCAKKAKKLCDKGDHGKAILVAIGDSDTKCSYTCADGTKGAVACPKRDQVTEFDQPDEVVCNVEDGPSTWCVEAEQGFTSRLAAEDGHIAHVDLSDWGSITLDEARRNAKGYDGAFFLTVVPLGTCDDVGDCAKKANKACAEIGETRAKKVWIDLDDEGGCNDVCDGGTIGTVVCLDKGK